jgi:hypothetical protein
MSRGGKWRRQYAQTAALLAAVAAGTSNLYASDTLYQGASGGSWNTAGNWSSGIPTTGSNALIVEAPSGVFAVNLNDDYSSATAIGELVLDSIGSSGSVELNQTTSGDNLFSATEIIGDNGPGSSAYGQTVATNSLTGPLILGDNSGGNGTYSLSGTGLLSAAEGYVGNSGTGTFIESGGNATFTSYDSNNDSLSLGDQAGSDGNYILSGGSLGFNLNESIGTNGTGTFIQSGGTNSGYAVVLGYFASGSGLYSLSNGSVSATNDDIGWDGAGLFTQSGGTNSTGYLGLGVQAGSNGVYSLSGSNATLSATGGYIGDAGSGEFLQNGGSATFTGADSNYNSLSLGNQAGSNGYYILSGGTLSCDDNEAIGTNGAGTFIQSGGTNSAYALIAGYFPGASGTFELFGGSISTGVAESIGLYGTGGFTQVGGTNSVGTSLQLGYYAGSSGVYSLSGISLSTLTAPTGYIGYGGSGTFVQSGGSASFTSNDTNDDSLSLGEQAGSNGTYTLSGGTLSAVDYESVGFHGSGTFVQSGGTNSGFGFILGSAVGGSGSYSLSNGSLSGSYDYVGAGGSGVFVQSGGTNSASTNLVVGYEPGSSGTYNQTGGNVTAATLYIAYSAASGSLAAATGVYSLSGSSLTTLSGNLGYVGYLGSGTFTQSGGSATFSGADSNSNSLSVGDQATGNGTYILSAGTLTTSANLSVGTNGAGTFMQSGGTNLAGASGYSVVVGYEGGGSGMYIQSGGSMTTGTLYIAYSAASAGVYSLSGSATLSADLGYVGSGGNGTFTQSGGSATFTKDDSNFDSLSLGNDAGSKGIYTLSAGSLGFDVDESIGTSGAGTFIQSGGTNSGNTINVGYLFGGSGSYLLSNGLVSAKSENIGGNAGSTGTFTQSGGTNSVSTELALGPVGGSGSYLLSNGSVSAESENIGGDLAGSTDTFTQSGGTNSVSAQLALGSIAGGSGSYSLSNGLLLAPVDLIGQTGSGVFVQSGGTNSASTNIGVGDDAGSDGTYIQSGGSVTTGLLDLGHSAAKGSLAASAGLYSLSGSSLTTLSARYTYVGEYGSGTFTQSGGSATFTSETGDLDGLSLGVYTGSNGTYLLSGGTLQVTYSESIGSGSTGTFIQSGGINTTEYFLVVGDNAGGRGVYSLSNGSVVAGLDTYEPEVVGGSDGSNGTFIQSGGTNTGEAGFALGYYAGSSGTYNLSGGTLNMAVTPSLGQEYVGYGGAGTVVQSGGVNNALQIYLGYQAGSTGTYQLSGGTVTADQTDNNGTFTQTGGTASLGAVTGTGEISVGNVLGSSATMTVSSIMQDAVTILSTGGLTITANSAATNTLNALTIDGNGTLNLTNNALYINYGSSPDPTTSIRAYLVSGYNGGHWNGPGISSFSAAANDNYAVGYADGADGVVSGLSSGQIEIKYTLYGDTNLDGTVNSIDFGNMAANFGKSGKVWDQGDFDYNGTVNSIDFGLLAGNFGKSASGAAVALPSSDWAALDAFAAANGLTADVPEPGSAALALMTGMGFLARRHRFHAPRCDKPIGCSEFA